MSLEGVGRRRWTVSALSCRQFQLLQVFHASVWKEAFRGTEAALKSPDRNRFIHSSHTEGS